MSSFKTENLAAIKSSDPSAWEEQIYTRREVPAPVCEAAREEKNYTRRQNKLFYFKSSSKNPIHRFSMNLIKTHLKLYKILDHMQKEKSLVSKLRIWW